MKYKMICIDMDGTLLNSKYNISEKNKKALYKAHQMGVEIVITTGRIYNNARYYSDLIGVQSPVIAANGALIMEKHTGKIIYKNVLKPNECHRILDVLEKYKLVPHFHTIKEIYVNNYIHKVASKMILSWKLPKNLRIKGINIRTREKWEEIIDKSEIEFFKCIVFSNSTAKLELAKNELKKIDGIEIASSSKNNLEINAKGVCKGNAIIQLANYYNISKDEIICIGDNENDLSMIKEAGLGVAMGNAIPILKNEANYITDTNINDGVAKVVDKFIFNNNFDL